MWEGIIVGCIVGLVTGVLSPLAVDRLREGARRREEATALREIVEESRTKCLQEENDELRRSLYGTMEGRIRQCFSDRPVQNPTHLKERETFLRAAHPSYTVGLVPDTMSPDDARKRFREFEAVKWLKLPPLDKE